MLTTEGARVKVTILSTEDGKAKLRATAPEEGLTKEFTLLRGTYLICIRGAEEHGGKFAWKLAKQTDETGTEAEETDSTEPAAEAEPDDAETEPGESTEPEENAEPEESTEPEENAGPAAEEEAEPAETDAAGTETELPAETNEEETGDRETAVPKGTEAQAVSVRLYSNVPEGEDALPGTEIVITAEVTGTDRPYHLLWQYSPDGGRTVLDAEDASGNEYRYTLDETNMQYLWRVAVIFDTPEE